MIAALLAALPLVSAATVQTFKAPAACPTCQSDSYTGKSNGSLPVHSVVPGRVYDRFITVWLENTDFESAAASATFQKIAKDGILLTQYHGVTHPSEPNYIAAMMGDFFGMHDDADYFLPYNVSTLVDLLDTKNISWASYQENMPSDGFDKDYTQNNYISGSGNYTYYKRKHNPHIIANTIAANPDRALRVRNFNDFAVDVNASALPQHVWVTPNMANDAHDTDVNFVSAWLEYWLVPLLQNPNFNNNKTLVQLTFDENESYGIQNRVYTVLLGGAVPQELRGTNDTSFYTHYSMLSSVENNWGLPSLGRQDTNKTMARVWEFQANKTGYENYTPQESEIPMLNLTGMFPGVCNSGMWTAVTAPNTSAVGAGNASVWYNQSATSLDANAVSAPVNLTAMNMTNPVMVNPNFTYANHSVVNASSPAAVAAKNASGNGTASSANGKPSGAIAVSPAAGLAATLVAGVALVLVL